MIRHIKGRMALAHNGNLTNAAELRAEFELAGAIFHTTSDTEVIAYAITRERLAADSPSRRPWSRAMDQLKGRVFAGDHEPPASSSPRGTRRASARCASASWATATSSPARAAPSTAIGRASSCAMWSRARSWWLTRTACAPIRTHCGGRTGLCVFEYIYFARPDSVMDGVQRHTGRGGGPARSWRWSTRCRRTWSSACRIRGLDAALGYSQQSGIPYGIGFLKNKYIGRTFIQPNQKPAGERRAHQAEPHRGHREGQARGAGG